MSKDGMGRQGAKKVSLVVTRTFIDIYEFWEDKDHHIYRLFPPLHRATHYHRSMGTSYRWEENGVPQIITDLYQGQFKDDET